MFISTGLPEYNVAPFDPHTSKYVEQRRGDAGFLGGYRLLLSEVSEYGWTDSTVTKYRTDFENNRIVYSQSFPEKSLDGLYDFRGRILGQPMHTKGVWNMTLYDYSQTTSITRIGGPGGLLKVRVEIDKIGDLKLHITDLFNGKKFIGGLLYTISSNCQLIGFNNFDVISEFVADKLINYVWQPGFPFIKPLINDLVSTAFTDIFNESFRYFPLNEIIPE